MKEDCGLLENPTERQLQEIIQGKVKRKNSLLPGFRR
jgi:hypothetical protein